jgi:hypothetical protein
LHVPRTGFGVGITPVAKEVDEDVRNTNFFGDFKKTVEMLILRVLFCAKLIVGSHRRGGTQKTYHAAVRDKTEEMQTTISFLGTLERLLDVFYLVHLPILQGHVNPNDLFPPKLQISLHTHKYKLTRGAILGPQT